MVPTLNVCTAPVPPSPYQRAQAQTCEPEVWTGVVGSRRSLGHAVVRVFSLVESPMIRTPAVEDTVDRSPPIDWH